MWWSQSDALREGSDLREPHLHPAQRVGSQQQRLHWTTGKAMKYEYTTLYSLGTFVVCFRAELYQNTSQSVKKQCSSGKYLVNHFT